MNPCRHLPTVARVTLNWVATSPVDVPPAQARTSFARWFKPAGTDRECATDSSCWRSSSRISRARFGLPVGASHSCRQDHLSLFYVYIFKGRNTSGVVAASIGHHTITADKTALAGTYYFRLTMDSAIAAFRSARGRSSRLFTGNAREGPRRSFGRESAKGKPLLKVSLSLDSGFRRGEEGYFLIAFSKRPRTSFGSPTPSMVRSLPFLPYQSMRGDVDLR